MKREFKKYFFKNSGEIHKPPSVSSLNITSMLLSLFKKDCKFWKF